MKKVLTFLLASLLVVATGYAEVRIDGGKADTFSRLKVKDSNGTMTFAGGSITDSSGAISFGNENILTTGVFTSEHLASTDDAAIGDDLTVGGNVLVTGVFTSEHVASTDDMTVGDDISILGDITQGSATADCGTITMIKGGQTGDPQVQFALSADDAGDFSITTDTGNIHLEVPANMDISWKAGTNTGYLAYGADGDMYIRPAESAGAIYLSAGSLVEVSAMPLQMGSATIDCSTFTMIKGAQTGDPQLQIALTADANGDVSLTPDTGALQLLPIKPVIIGNTTANFAGGANVDGGRLAIVDNTDAMVSIENYSSTDGNTGTINFLKSGSSTKGTLAPTAQNEIIGQAAWTAIDSGNNKETIARMQGLQSNASAAQLGGDLRLETYATDRNVNTDQLRLYADGSVGIVQAQLTSTNFKKVLVLAGFTLWISDGTTAEGALTGVEGDICLNGGTGAGQPAYCDSSGTNWSDM